LVNTNVGSLNPDEVYDAFYNPATRRLIQVTPDNIDYAHALVEQIQVRKNLLIQKGIITNPYNV
jgi:hypothetical protein